jgi:hypothetical protein
MTWSYLRGAALSLVLGCSSPPEALPTPWRPADPVEITNECDAGDPAFVRRAWLVIGGRRPTSQGEVDAAVALLGELRKVEGLDVPAARRRLLGAVMHDEPYRLRWSDFFKDALRVARTQSKSASTCYGSSDDPVASDPTLALYVRDHDARTQTAPPLPAFTMKELLASTLVLDDLSVLYRANLFAMLGRPMTGAASALEIEAARRNDFGATFESAYVGRDVTCLACHNSEYSVTSATDPLRNRHWPVPGAFERALFGSPNGAHPSDDPATHGTDVLRARGMLRTDGVLGAGSAPYGWAAACGTFETPSSDDPLNIDTYFASLRGRRTSIWDLEAALQRGMGAIVNAGLGLDHAGHIADPEQAFAYLVALNIVERVWVEVIGTPLTAAHHFPRTQAQRDVLAQLTNGFVAARFSLRWLLAEVATHPVFNLRAPSDACGTAPYSLNRLLNPWSDSEAEAERRGNAPSDGVTPLPPRLLRRSLHAAMNWPIYSEYPGEHSEEETLALASGFFLRDAEPGRRSFDFQGRLAWEAAYGSCKKLGERDFISELLDRTAADQSATLKDALAVLQDRLLGERLLASDTSLIEALVGTSLESRDLTLLEDQLRTFCGNLIVSPSFLLHGLAPSPAEGIPHLTAGPDDYAASYARLSLLLGSF